MKFTHMFRKSLLVCLCLILLLLTGCVQKQARQIPHKMMYADVTRRGKPWSKNPSVIKFEGRYLKQ